jgi:PadR family transcriptional regulator PadR
MALVDTEFALLQALIAADSYGLELIQRVQTDTNGEVRLLQGRVYPVLRSLEAGGLVESYAGQPLPDRSGRPRRYYRITSAGMDLAVRQAAALAGLVRPALERIS